jgi:acyl-CoA synthetase (NDP forming)
MRSITGAEESLRLLAEARSIAIVGASSKPFTVSWWPLELLERYGYAGAVYPVNPNRDAIAGVRCYPSLAEVPGPVELAIVVLPAELTLDAVRACADAGARAVVLAAQGFSEHGEEGRAREEALSALGRERGIRIVGPNTDGIASFATGIVVSIQPLLGEGVQVGPVAVVAQSGATSASILQRLKRAGIGCRYAITTGNETDLDLADYLSYVLQDPAVEIALCFVETIRRPGDFRRVAALAAALGKPIALIKAGASEPAARRTAAHTGALAGDDALYEALFQADGVLRVAEPSELVAVAKLALAGVTPRSRGIGVISVSGGGASIVADKAVAMGLEVPALSAAAEVELDRALSFGGGFNPCDLTGEIASKPSLAGQVYEIFCRQPELATVVYARKHLTGTVGEEAAGSLAEIAGRPDAAPLVVYGLDGEVERPEESAVYAGHGMPVFTSLQDVFVAVDRLAGYAAFRSRAASPRRASAPAAEVMPPDPRDVPAICGIAAPRQALARDAATAVRLSDEIGYPVVLKVESHRLPHRSDIGGVALGLRSAAEVERAFASIWDRAQAFLCGGAPDGMLIQEQVEGGVELIVGAKVDAQLGPFVLVGLGGVHAEVMKDVVLRPAPVAPDEALAMLDELRGAPLLHGHRGAPAVDLDAVAEAVSSLSRFAARHAGVLDAIDLNPLIALPRGRGVRAVDVLVVRRADLV